MARPSRPAEDWITVGEFYSLVPEGQKADLLDGVIHLAPPDSRRANELTGFLLCLLADYNDAKAIGGAVFITRFALKNRCNDPFGRVTSAARVAAQAPARFSAERSA